MLPAKERHRLAVKRTRTKWKEQGLCIECGKALDRTGSLCQKCTDVKRRKAKENRGCKYQGERLVVFQRLSGKEKPECKYCCCDYFPALELNHKNGGGYADKLQHKVGIIEIIHQLLIGERKLEDYEVTCRVCNNRLYAERKWGLYWEVKFIKEPRSS